MNDLTLICETCLKPVEGDTGSLYIRLPEATAAEAGKREWREQRAEGAAINIHEFLTMREDAHWRTGHDACRDDHDQSCYEIDAVRIATWRHLARWTADLMEKNWFAATDWDELLRELSGDAPAKRIRVAVQEAA